METTLIYAGIGSRETPTDQLKLMTAIAEKLDKLGYTLRSGGADGADTAFEKGATHKEIYLPWKGFNNNASPLHIVPSEALTLAELFHPNWSACSQGAQKLHARNCQQILGQNLDAPVSFVICWHKGTGGTTQACRIATAHNIPVINLFNPDWKTKLNNIIKGDSIMETTKPYNVTTDYKARLYSQILDFKGNHPPLEQISSCVTYAREIGMFTAFYIPFEYKTDEQVYKHLQTHTTLRPPYFRTLTDNLITKTPVTPEDFLAQNKQHREFLASLPTDTTQTFIIDKGILVETKSLTPEDLLTKHGIIAKNHLTRTVTYSAHAVAIPDHTLTSTYGPAIGIPHRIFKQLNLNKQNPIMFLRNPVIKADGVHFAYPIPTALTHAISVHPYFCDGMNLDFDGDQINIYKIIHPDNIAKARTLITTRYPSPLPTPDKKDFRLIPLNLHALSLQDYMYNTLAMQDFIQAKPSKKVTQDLINSAHDLCKSRTEQQFAQHLAQSKAYEGLFRSKADVGKVGGLYKKLVYAFPNYIQPIMNMVEPLTQATLDQKHTASDFSVDRITLAFSNLETESNYNYILNNIPKEHHDLINYLHSQLKIKPLAIRHKENMPLLTYLGTKFTNTYPANFKRPSNSDNIFHFLTSLNNPTSLTRENGVPELPELTEDEAIYMSATYMSSLLNKSEMIPQKYLDPKDQQVYEHRFFKTIIDKTNKMSEYLSTRMVSVPHDDNNLYLLPPANFCPYQRTEKDPESQEPITFIPTYNGHTTSATPLNIPYRHNTEHARLVYACNNIKQAMQLKYPEQPLCRTKHHSSFNAGVNLKATFRASPYTYEDAVIISQTASIKLTTIDGKPAIPGDKITGRHGNKAVISLILPDDEMPDLAEIVFSPMTVTSRKNFGFLAEIQSNIIHNNQPHIEVPIEELLKQPNPTIPNGTLTGTVYILRNSHTAESSTKAYAEPKSYTQYLQPAQGETISLNHIYALDVLGLRSLIAEFYSFRSNKEQITNQTTNLEQEPESIQVIRTVYTKLMS